MLKPFFHECGTSSKPARDGLLPVHPPSPRTARDTPGIHHVEYSELAMRPSPDVIIILTTPAASLTSCPSGPARTARRTRAALPPWLVARRRQWKESTMKPARKAISTLRGEGTWGTTGGREQVWGQGLGRLQTILPRLLRSPNLACKMRPRHAARVQRPRGQTPEAIRPEPQTSMTRSRTDTLAHHRLLGHAATHVPTQIQVGARTREFPYSGCPYSTRQ